VTRIAVLSDTHIMRGAARQLPATAFAELERADVILHCGDIVDDALLGDLRHYAPVHAVLGNNDRALVGILPETRVVDVEGLRIGMVHDSGRREGREVRMSRRFHGAQVVLFGHSHIPVNAPGLGGQLLMNPGSPTERRGQPAHTMGVLVVDDGLLREHRIVALD
jgi:hypothetical protein